jgi:hypothetical protein
MFVVPPKMQVTATWSHVCWPMSLWLLIFDIFCIQLLNAPPLAAWIAFVPYRKPHHCLLEGLTEIQQPFGQVGANISSMGSVSIMVPLVALLAYLWSSTNIQHVLGYMNLHTLPIQHPHFLSLHIFVGYINIMETIHRNHHKTIINHSFVEFDFSF